MFLWYFCTFTFILLALNPPGCRRSCSDTDLWGDVLLFAAGFCCSTFHFTHTELFCWIQVTFFLCVCVCFASSSCLKLLSCQASSLLHSAFGWTMLNCLCQTGWKLTGPKRWSMFSEVSVTFDLSKWSLVHSAEILLLSRSVLCCRCALLSGLFYTLYSAFCRSLFFTAATGGQLQTVDLNFYFIHLYLPAQRAAAQQTLSQLLARLQTAHLSQPISTVL